MTIYGYVRISSKDQKDYGLSAEVQKEKLIKSGVPPENVRIDGGKTASVKDDMIEYQFKNGHYLIDINLNNRPEFVKLITEIQPRDEIRFLRWDRLNRNVILSSVFRDDHKRKQVTLTPLEDTKDAITIEIISALSQDEVLRTIKRNDSTSEGIFQRGAYPYRSPIGLIKNIKVEKGILRYPNLPEGCLVIDSEKVEMVKNIFERMAKGEYYQDICNIHKINAQTLYNIIKNKTYLGMTHYKNTWVKSDLVPQIITENLWNKANEKIKSKN